MSRRALFCIDIQRFMALDPETSVQHAAELNVAASTILSTVRRIIDEFRQKKELSPFLIVFVQHEESPSQGSLVRDTEPWKLVYEPREDVDEEILVHKTHGNTFKSHPELASKLQADGVNEIITFGIQSDCCVEQTSQGALGAGFPVTVLSGAHATYDCDGKTAKQIQRDVDERLGLAGAKILNWEDALTKWKLEFSK